jgi:hypothetical protein
MGTSKHVGRVAMPGKVGRARVGRAVGRAPTPARAPTDVIRPGEEPPPVFVDASGRRRRRLRRTMYAIGAILLLALLALWLSQVGGGVGPR